MSYLKLSFNFIKYLIINNPLKILLITLASICFNYAGTLPGEYVYTDLVSQSKDGNTNLYIVRESSNSSGYEVVASNKIQVVKNGQIRQWDYHDGNILLFIIFAVFSIVVTIITFIPEDDINWDIRYCYQRAITTLIYCELEGDTYYYMIMGRLIQKRKDQIRYTSNVAGEMRIHSMSDVYRLPKFSTKTQKRNNNLDKLGIN